ncbi:MAG: ChaN family lipoprotein [Gemmatimonadota bacterium]
MRPSATRVAHLALAVVVPLAGACARPGAPAVAPARALESRIFAAAPSHEVTFETMMRAASRADVVFFGEQHDDPATHRAELSVLAALGNGARPVVLSLEMFERDVQGVLDDYLAGRITEAEFLAHARPWERYTTDYRALVELARARGWAVVASNIPRRLASAVSRKGLSVLDTIPSADRALVAREISCPRDAYYTNFAEQMKGHSAGDGPASAADSATMRAMTDRFYEAQCVKDETMAESIDAALTRAGEGAIVLHLDGAFHSDYGLGTAARVVRRRPGVARTVLSAIPVDTLATAVPGENAARGDFIIFTRKPPAASAPPATSKP